MKKVLLVSASLVTALSAVHAQTPAGLNGLRLWLDPSDAATVHTSGGLVTQLDDKSGFGNHATQADVNRQPVIGVGALGGQNSIHLDAAGPGNFAGTATDDSLLVNNAFVLNRAYSVFMVDQYWGGVQGRTLTSLDNNWLLGHWNGAESHYTGNFIGPNVGAGVNNPLVSSAIGTGTSNYLFRRDRLSGYSLGNLNQPGRLIIGEDTAGAWNEGSQSDVGDVIAFNRAVTDTERWQVEDYLRTKYNQPFRISHEHSTRTTVFSGGDVGEGLDFTGNFLAAVNVGGPGGFTIGNATFTADTGVTAENHIPAWQSTTFGGATPTSNDSNLRTVMDSIRWSAVGNGGPEDIQVSIPGLVAGNTYKVQLLFGEAGAGSNRHFNVEMEGKRVIQDFAEGAHRGTDDPTALGTAVVHEFVATDGTLNFRLHSAGLSLGDLNQLINGFTVEDRGVTGITTTGSFTTSSQLDLSGNFVYAVSVGGPGGQTVGSAAFTPDNVAGVRVGAENIITGTWTPQDFTGTPDDAALGAAMSSIRWSETTGAQDGISVDLAVVPGEQYKLQLLFMEGCCDRGFDVSLEGVLTVRDFNPNGMGATLTNETGAVITHTFTAGDNSFNIMLDGFATGFTDKNPILNAFTLERIPEPGTAGLTLLAAAAALARRRRA